MDLPDSGKVEYRAARSAQRHLPAAKQSPSESQIVEKIYLLLCFARAVATQRLIQPMSSDTVFPRGNSPYKVIHFFTLPRGNLPKWKNLVSLQMYPLDRSSEGPSGAGSSQTIRQMEPRYSFGTCIRYLHVNLSRDTSSPRRGSW